MQSARSRETTTGAQAAYGKTASDHERESAIEWLELEVARTRLAVERYRIHCQHRILRKMRSHDMADELSTRLTRLEVLLDCVRAGMHKGRGRRRPALTYYDHVRRRAIVAFAERREKQLRQEGQPSWGPYSAKRQAAEEARALAAERYGNGMTAGTIKRMMRKSTF